jgi:hypothetical protein
MFTRTDYHEYFEQIAGLERLMIYRIHEVLPSVDEPGIRGTLETIANDEKRHYGYIRGIFDSILLTSETERRRFMREHMLGKARIRLAGDGREFEGYCVDISRSGACVEFSENIPVSGDFEIWIEPFNGESTRHFQGRLAWNVEISPKLRVGNIKFKIGVEFFGA